MPVSVGIGGVPVLNVDVESVKLTDSESATLFTWVLEIESVNDIDSESGTG